MKTAWIDRIDMCGKIRPHNTWRKVDVHDKANYITASDTGYLWHELNPAYHDVDPREVFNKIKDAIK